MLMCSALNMKIPEIPSVVEPPSKNCKVKRIIFCRHAETSANASFQLQGSDINESLNDKGINQAEALARRLAKKEDIDLIVTSDLERAVQTSEIIADAYPKPLEIIKEPELREISWGIWEGMVCPDLHSLFETWESGDFTARAPGGETPIDVRERVLPVIYSLLERPEKTILVVAHGRLLRILLSSILYGNLYHMQSFNHRNTCVNVVDVYYESAKNRNSPTSLTNISCVKINEPKKQQPFPLIKNLSGGGIVISPIMTSKRSKFQNSSESAFRIKSKNDFSNNLKTSLNSDFKTPIFDVDLSGDEYKVKFMPVILDSVEHLTADLY